MPQLRILIADDHALLLSGVRTLLETVHDVVGSVSDGRKLLEESVRLKPDLVILDISMPQMNGIEAAKQIIEKTSAKIIFLSMHTNPAYLRHALNAGASGYVLKTGAIEELLNAIREVSQGNHYFSPGFGANLLAGVWLRSGRPLREKEPLTARQREIVQLIAEGRTSKEIAYLLGISAKTVEFHRAGATERLGVHSTAELVRVATEQEFIARSEPKDRPVTGPEARSLAGPPALKEHEL